MAFMDPYTGSWTEIEASHLGRRAGFGGTPGEIADMVNDGMDTAVNQLVDYSQVDTAYETLLESFPDDNSDEGRIKNPVNERSLRGSWIHRMQHTSQPLQEQFTLFLHDTLVSEFNKVRNGVLGRVRFGNDGSNPGNQQCTTGTLPPDDRRKNKITSRLLRDQHKLLRTMGHGPYRELLRRITRDPAMLIYLDNRLNLYGRAAQENYAREIMELFSMGVGNYSEEDVREVARAFTGETIDVACSNDWPYTHLYLNSAHDPDEKIVFGNTFNMPGPGDDTNHVIDLMLDEVSGSDISPAHSTLPAASIFMSWKLINWFVHEEIPVDHDSVAELATIMYNTQVDSDNYNMRETLRTLLKSVFFYDQAWGYRMYKHPVNFMVMALRNLGIAEKSYTTTASNYLESMGMALFQPPNVGGWNHGSAWINSSNLIFRFNYADRLSISTLMTNNLVDNLIPGFITNEQDHTGMIEYFRARLLQTTLRPEDESTLQQFLADIENSAGNTTTRYRRKIRGLLHLVMTLPQYQLK